MNEHEKKVFIISEAKDLLTDINNSISKTRDKSWQLLGFLIAINVYLITSVIDGKQTYQILGLIFICAIGNIVVGKNLIHCMFPDKIQSNGGYPSKIYKIIEQEEDPDGIDFYEVLSTNYEWSIEQNMSLLSKMANKYNNGLWGLIILSCSILLFFLVYFLIVESSKLSITS